MTLKALPGTASCFVCGDKKVNARTLELNIYWDEEAKCSLISFVPNDTWCGYEGVVHGGILAAILDDAMTWAIKSFDEKTYLTAKLTIAFKRMVMPGERYSARGFLLRKESRRAYTSAVIEDAEGNICVEGNAIFVRAK